jgi:acetyltransferase-like isoleucine patch superfamily enzyme
MKKSLVRKLSNRILALIARFSPGATSLRPFLHKLRGVRITGKVFIGDDVYLENEYPECIEIHDGAQIALRSTLIAHTRGPGRIVIGKDVFIGANSLISVTAGDTLNIGEGSVIVALSVVASSVPSHTLFGNQKARALGKVTIPLTMTTSYRKFLSGLRPLDKK